MPPLAHPELLQSVGLEFYPWGLPGDIGFISGMVTLLALGARFGMEAGVGCMGSLAAFHGLSWEAWRLAAIFFVVTAFAAIARLMRSVTTGGAAAGWACAFLLTWGGGFELFGVLVAVFVCVSLATTYGYSHKARLGLAERRHGRSAGQVFSNLGVAAFCALTAHFWQPGLDLPAAGIWTLAAVAALAEAAADTVSSEIGQATSSSPRLITSFARVPAGTDGAVSWSGSLAGLLAAAMVSATAVLGELISLRAAGIALAAGFSGMLFDSLLGATLQRRGRIGNNLVNLLGTAFAAGVAIFFASSFSFAIRLF